MAFWITAYVQHKKQEGAWQKNIEQRRKEKIKEQIKRLTGEQINRLTGVE
jgi:hypothetical protein